MTNANLSAPGLAGRAFSWNYWTDEIHGDHPKPENSKAVIKDVCKILSTHLLILKMF